MDEEAAYCLFPAATAAARAEAFLQRLAGCTSGGEGRLTCLEDLCSFLLVQWPSSRTLLIIFI